ncbi:phyl [Drosophila busckii]|uniref:Phyl n=2 Tax=Drosophila busckii TaxID=30019 RepID=A0A0M4E4U6_DROBS|nr:phyl [Drosophila busckii]
MPAAASSSASAASASEYLKRTCLICGCQTNQTINIYEPRSGPNIVQLIQAKFKFQPLNEDKFLCFSCNNWLINWHSLQAVNSNDAESQSQSPAHMSNNSSGALVQQRAKVRPIAQVRPQPQVQVPQRPQLPTAVSAAAPASSPLPATVISYNKRRFGRRNEAGLRNMRKMLRYCCVCGGTIVLRLLHATSPQTLTKLAQRKGYTLCRKCRHKEQSRRQTVRALRTALVKPLPTPTPNLPHYQRLPAPRVDGKVVAMFRRLGTTLSTEQQVETEATSAVRNLRIMSPVKQRPRWTRALEQDEVLLEFDSAISEVMPASKTTARRRLRYQLANEAEAEVEVIEVQSELTEAQDKVSHQTLAGLKLPLGLSITLV